MSHIINAGSGAIPPSGAEVAHWPTPQHAQAWKALSVAAERVGAYQWAHCRTRRYNPTEGHRALVNGMKDLSRGCITPDDAMGLLTYGESAEELGKARRWEAEQRRLASQATATGGDV